MKGTDNGPGLSSQGTWWRSVSDMHKVKCKILCITGDAHLDTKFARTESTETGWWLCVCRKHHSVLLTSSQDRKYA